MSSVYFSSFISLSKSEAIKLHTIETTKEETFVRPQYINSKSQIEIESE